jgi:hypothetical protein
MFLMKLNLKDRWQALFILVQLQLNKDCFSQIPGLWKEQCSRRCHTRQQPRTPLYTNMMYQMV